MADFTRHYRKTASLASTLGLIGLLAGCAGSGVIGPPVETHLVGEDTYLILGKYTSVSDTRKVLMKQMKDRADKQCPGGWAKLAEGPNPQARMGGWIWKINCTAVGMSAPRPAADAGPVVAPPAKVSAVATPTHTAPAAGPAPQDDLMQVLTAAALKAAPDLSELAAKAIARAQLHSLAAAGLKVTDAKGRNVPLQ